MSPIQRYPMLGLNFAQIESLLQNRRQLSDYIHTLYEIGATTIRIPFYWRRLIEYSDRTGQIEFKPNERMIDQYHQFVNHLPVGIRVLGCVVNGSPFVGARYCYDQSVLKDCYREYLRFLLRSFLFIQDIELWNEPNASDFYFSIIEKDGTHRPWHGEEFVRDVVLPGSALLRESAFRGHILGVTFAENGLVGHRLRKPAFANILKGLPAFESQAEENAQIGSFYFKSNFAREVLAALVPNPDEPNSLPFDVFGVHPYPYFQAGATEFWKHSVQLVNDFYGLLDSYGLGSFPVWATEVGVRSLDLHHSHYYDGDQQKAFIHLFAQGVQFGTRLERIYWYKYNDQNWDLIQEKTFGIFDHYNNKKPAYYALKSLLLTQGPTSGKAALLDDFQYGIVHTRGAIDPEFWKLTKNTHFAYTVCGRVLEECTLRMPARLLVYPGRNLNDWIKLETLNHLVSSIKQQLLVDVGLQLYAETAKNKTTFEVKIGFSSVESPDNYAIIRFTLDSSKGLLMYSGLSSDGPLGFTQVYSDRDLGSFRGLRISASSERLCITLHSMSGVDHEDYMLPESIQKWAFGPLHLSIEICRISGPRGFIELTGFRAYRDSLKLPDLWD